jgi:hypothetical protein
MTTDARSESNRQNAYKSTGPRSRHGKRRSSQNACRHGLFARPLFTDSERVEPLARQLVGEDTGVEVLACARAVARSSLDFVRALRMRVSLISRTLQFGRLRRSYSPNRLVLRHGDFDGLISSHSRMGRASGGTRSSMLRATPG